MIASVTRSKMLLHAFLGVMPDAVIPPHESHFATPGFGGMRVQRRPRSRRYLTRRRFRSHVGLTSDHVDVAWLKIGGAVDRLSDYISSEHRKVAVVTRWQVTLRIQVDCESFLQAINFMERNKDTTMVIA